jgi:hypothetical protein
MIATRASFRQLRIGLVISLIVGCGGSSPVAEPPQPANLVDTGGAAVTWSCTRDGCDRPTALLGTPPARSVCPAGGVVPGYGLLLGTRVTQLCEGCWSASGSSSNFASEGSGCRPVACSTNADCPQLWFGPPAVTCQNGLCQDLKIALDFGDVMTLCLASIPRSATQDWKGAAAAQASTLAGTSCPSKTSCAVPPQCRQP